MAVEVAEPNLNRWETKAQRWAERLPEPLMKARPPDPGRALSCTSSVKGCSVSLLFLSPTLKPDLEDPPLDSASLIFGGDFLPLPAYVSLNICLVLGAARGDQREAGVT